MLLAHQTGSVKVGEVVRYTVTYTPSADRILPIPSSLRIRIKNTSAVALRAAYLHGPYTLYVAAYSSNFNPNVKVEDVERDGIPEYEPFLKAGGTWAAKLVVPEDIRASTGGPGSPGPSVNGPSVTWIIEIISQVVFSASAAVHFELLIGRDEKSLQLGLVDAAGAGQFSPGRVEDHQLARGKHVGQHAAQQRGVFSKALMLGVDDTSSLWNKPQLADRLEDGSIKGARRTSSGPGSEQSLSTVPSTSSTQPTPKKQKKVHIVIVTHGLHSNLGADMLYLKESIEETAKAAQENRKKRHYEAQNQSNKPESREEEDKAGLEDDDDDEEVIVRGFAENALRTERGIKYLGKRLAKYVLAMTYPEQPFLPIKKSATRSLSHVFSSSSSQDSGLSGTPAHTHSSIHHTVGHPDKSTYRITSISFIGHSLGGLVQTYAVGYIQKHSPHFFDEIKPVNFVAMATPFLGLSNENPIYVKFALDFGLVGRTGKDLGLTWRAPNLARSGWEAVVGGMGSASQKQLREEDPGAKPLLRILPTGPAHKALRMFRNRTVYSNVVNDGIVPLRTGCLLFLDWRGLGRVEKARRENGFVGTMVEWGWSEMTGANTTSKSRFGHAIESETSSGDDAEDESVEASSGHHHGEEVPQPSAKAIKDDNSPQISRPPTSSNSLSPNIIQQRPNSAGSLQDPENEQQGSSNPFSSLLTFFSPNRPKRPSPKSSRIYKRSQTVKVTQVTESSDSTLTSVTDRVTTSKTSSSVTEQRPGRVTRGDSLLSDPNEDLAPPTTTIFESAANLLSPPLPSTEFIIDPTSRPRTIFHDRVYHPSDIPKAPTKPPHRRSISHSSESSAPPTPVSQDVPPSFHPSDMDTSSMKVEEKIARAYHRDLSWRKVLVRLEPDAHNNMVVRRMFANAYGWPVVKHLCDTHFADTYVARMRDDEEPSAERAKSVEQGTGAHGGETKDVDPPLNRTNSEQKEAGDEVGELKSAESGSSARQAALRDDASVWSDHYFDVTDDDDEVPSPRPGGLQGFWALPEEGRGKVRLRRAEGSADEGGGGTDDAEIAKFLTASPVAMRTAVSEEELKNAGSEQVAKDEIPAGGEVGLSRVAKGGSRREDSAGNDTKGEEDKVSTNVA
ncbi:MAG: hypothetical protein M1824_003916 [Vezdaea acicularis]|nr:MAG: hypothetical protein M1824_003916 [Vezdaea acicularis]